MYVSFFASVQIVSKVSNDKINFIGQSHKFMLLILHRICVTSLIRRNSLIGTVCIPIGTELFGLARHVVWIMKQIPKWRPFFMRTKRANPM